MCFLNVLEKNQGSNGKDSSTMKRVDWEILQLIRTNEKW